MVFLGGGSLVVAAPVGADGTTGAISGTVTAAAGGATLSGICVTATPPGPGGGSATTASDGSYTISGLAPGPYSVEFATGCGNTGNYAPQWWNGASSQTSGTPVQVSAGATASPIDAQLQAGGTVTGMVTAAAGGAGLAGICVSVWNTGSNGPNAQPSGTATTGSGGSYSVTGLGSNQYTVEFASGCGNAGDFVTQWWNGASTQQTATPFQLNAGFTMGSVDAQMVVGGGISGTVSDAVSNQVVQGVCVLVSSVANPNLTVTVVTDATGSYSVQGLPAGTFDVEFIDGGSCWSEGGIAVGYEPQYYDGQSSQASATPVPVDAGAISGPIDAQMVMGGSISGVVVAADGRAPLQGICVSATDLPFGVFGTASDGSFTIRGLPTGTYTVQFDNGCGNPQTYVPQSVQVSVTAPEVTTGVEVQMVLGTLPTVTSITPDSGPLSGGTPVTITGSGFTGATQVQFGFSSPPFVVVSDTEITTTSPMAPPSTVDVQVITPEGTSAPTMADKFTYTSGTGTLPTVTSVTPDSGPLSGGTPVTITGSGFTGATRVQFGFSSPPFVVVSDTEITTMSPMAPAGTVDVQVVTPAGTSAPTMADKFTYTSMGNAPTVTSLSPSSGPVAGGTQVTITGTNLSGATGVMFGTNPATSFTVLSGTEAIATSPQATTGGPVEVTVNSPNGFSMMTPGSQFTYLLAPDIWSPSVVGFVAGQANSLTITASGYPVPSISVGPGMPPWMVFTSGMGQMFLTGTPPARTKHVYSIQVTATNTAGSATQTLTLTVGSPPTFTSAPAVTFATGVDKQFTIRATGYPTPNLSETGNLPSGVTFASPANGSASLSGTPAAGTGGLYPITVTAHSATGTTQQSLVITVQEKPTFTSPSSVTWVHGVSTSFTVTTSHAYPAVVLSTSGTLPSWLTFTDNHDGTGTLTGDPGASAVRSTPYTFALVGTSGRTSVTQRFSLRVT
jgi:hypothetical protein